MICPSFWYIISLIRIVIRLFRFSKTSYSKFIDEFYTSTIRTILTIFSSKSNRSSPSLYLSPIT
nr:MAG TPA: hypothetical protein [Caudoviricetes sp.]